MSSSNLKYYKALYRLLMVTAAADKEFSMEENEYIAVVVSKIFGDTAVSSEFIASMSREFEVAIKTRKAFTQRYFDRQAQLLAQMSEESKEQVLQVLTDLSEADGRSTYREHYLIDKLKQAFSS